MKQGLLLTTIATAALGVVSAVSAFACEQHEKSAQAASVQPAVVTAAKAAAKAASVEYDAYVAGGAACKGRGIAATADGYSHLGCDACADMAACESELKAAGSLTQVVKLKNGVMFVHTAVGSSRVSAVQAAMARRTDRLAAMTAAGYKARLCPECKAMRGAMASGKLTREMVTIEGGCLTLMTSNDKVVVAKLHAMVEEQTAARIKS